MKRPSAAVLVATLFAAAAGGAYGTWTRGYAQQVSRPAAQPAAATGPARVLLNEILFQPAPGEPAWVELVNVGGAPAAFAGAVLENQAGERYALPQGLTLPGGGVLVVVFDGPARIEGLTVHAGRPTLLDADTGSVSLIVGATRQDSAMWSASGGPSFHLGRGGRVAPFRPGTTLGRPPSSTGDGPDAWTVFDPPQATPGRRNAYPPVVGLLPLSGAVLRTTSPTLSWYTVAAATQYRVQMAAESVFTTLLLDRSVEATSTSGVTTMQLPVGPLAPGRYFWRVVAAYADGQVAASSPPAVVWIGREAQVAERGSPATGVWDRLRREIGLVPVVHAAASHQAPAVAGVLRKTLPVPLILQQKDTRLLSLEAKTETGSQPWDAPWRPAPAGPFCSRASVAMVTAFFGGKLSQDRITYEAFKDFRAGPIFDLFVNNGFGDRDIKKSLTYALGAEPELRFNETLTAQEYFDLHKAEIDAGYPVVATTKVHAFVVVGYGEDERGKYLTINDPAIGQYDWLVLLAPGVVDADEWGPANTEQYMSTSFVMPRVARGVSDEPEIHQDSDGDGVMDFDEVQRFQTDPRAKDSDDDGIDDKQDIRAWVYAPVRGWAFVSPAGLLASDEDLDKKAMELDADSDDGGCLDGMEDTNGNGHLEAGSGESDNFEKDDDACLFGSQAWVNDITNIIDSLTTRLDIRHTIRFWFREVNGMRQGRATVTASFRYQDISARPGCPSNNIATSAPYRYTVDVEAEFVPRSDGTIAVIVNPPAGYAPPMRRITSTCPEVPPQELDGVPIGISGVLRNGVFDERVDFPVTGKTTGTWYYETHIRQIGRR